MTAASVPPSTRARTVLAEKVESCRSRGISRLPTVTKLAAEAGVARGTMWKATRELSELGVIVCSPRAGIRISRDASPPPAARPGLDIALSQNSWHRTARRLDHDIAAGRFTPGTPLPPTKVLCARYGVSNQTLRRALGSMIDSGRIELRRRRYHVRAWTSATRTGTVMLIARGDTPRRFLQATSRFVETYRAFEEVCAEANVRLELHTFDYTSGYLRDEHGRDRVRIADRDVSGYLGFLVWAQGLEGLNLPAFVVDLHRYHRPVSVLDESGWLDWMPLLNGYPMTRVFRLGLDARCGLEMGRHLRSLGHRRVAYMSTDPLSPRLDGVRQAFTEAGLDDAVRLFAPARVRQQAPVASDGDVGALVEALCRSSIMRDSPAGPALTRVLRAQSRELVSAARHETRYATLIPLIHRALSDREITAWVATNDSEALLCMRHIDMHTDNARPSIALVGFDDTFEASMNGLTSYNFAVGSYARGMLDHILRPDSRPVATAPVTYPGFVTPRASTH